MRVTDSSGKMGAVMYVIVAQVLTHVSHQSGEWHGSRQVPTFYLDEDTQGIYSVEGAIRVAKRIVNPLGMIRDEDLKIGAAKV